MVHVCINLPRLVASQRRKGLVIIGRCLSYHRIVTLAVNSSVDTVKIKQKFIRISLKSSISPFLDRTRVLMVPPECLLCFCVQTDP